MAAGLYHEIGCDTVGEAATQRVRGARRHGARHSARHGRACAAAQLGVRCGTAGRAHCRACAVTRPGVHCDTVRLGLGQGAMLPGLPQQRVVDFGIELHPGNFPFL